MTHDSSMSDSDTFKFLPWAPQYGTGLSRPAWVSESDTNGTERCGLNARQWANRHRSRGGIPDHWNIPDDAEMQRREAIRNQFIQMCRDIAKEGSK